MIIQELLKSLPIFFLKTFELPKTECTVADMLLQILMQTDVNRQLSIWKIQAWLLCCSVVWVMIYAKQFKT